ncbi:MAG: Tim44 domain-containing protein [Acidimicrobiales bacterium]|nr:Tim44 domain-containing protein [Hyphomonadaceae bacterium]RZV44680.1 MAG: Tim44 domain-containing protein [Acidimicrobiales bacterium]
MQEIILYAVLFLIVGSMLFSVLGKDVGHGSEPSLDPKDLLDKIAAKPDALDAEPEYEGPGAEGIRAIRKADASFTVASFMDGAKAAYGMILEAFADGDKETLSGLLSADVNQAYVDAIDDREKKELRQTTDLARLISAEIVDASRSGKTGKIKVLYVAELATALLDKAGEVVDGDLDVLSRIREVWSYERTLSSKNPNWVLSSVEPHDTVSGNAGGPDHSPDSE